MRFYLQVLFGQNQLEGGNVMRQQNLNSVEIQAEKISGIVENAGERFLNFLRLLVDLQPLLQRHEEAREVNRQNFFARFLGAKNSAQRADGFRLAGLVLVDRQSVRHF